MQDGRDGIVIYHADQKVLVGMSYKSVVVMDVFYFLVYYPYSLYYQSITNLRQFLDNPDFWYENPDFVPVWGWRTG